MSLESAPQRIYSCLQNHYAALAVFAGTILANTTGPELFIVHASDSIERQATLALPSAVPIAETGGNRAINIVNQGALLSGAVALAEYDARRTGNTRWGILGTAVLSQSLACTVDAIADRTWLDAAEKKLPDVGNSSILTGILTKLALDRFAAARQSEKLGKAGQKLVGAGLGIAALGATVGSYVVEGSQGGKLEMLSHAAGIAAGIFSHRFGRVKQLITEAVY